MDKELRAAIERATQRARRILVGDFAAQLDATYDVLPSGKFQLEGGPHLSQLQQFLRKKIIAAIEHKLAAGMTSAEAVADYIRDAAFTALNRFAALKMMEARDLVQECLSVGEQSSGYKEFYGLSPGLALLPHGAGYRTYIESLFDELSTEVKILFDRRDPASVLWPKRQAFESLLAVLNAPEIATIWGEDETIGWVYQYFNDPAERKQMREESAAPRNSRELAVRNQFFTPRYVVQFLTDNTLGRIWYEMRQGQTRLKELCIYMVRRPIEIFLHTGEEAPEAAKQENFSQEELLKQPVYVSYRAVKDPRTIKMLDPACGSMHFGLYAFDLYQAIYEEAWALEEDHGTSALQRTPGMKPLHERYKTRDAFLKDVPRLILEHNIHGIEIDPRAVQIASLALWMRAQRSWKERNIPGSDRPRIRRSNVVCAEPMPGEKELLSEFLQTHLSRNSEDRLIGQLVQTVFDSMQLAGEAGSLLKIEEDIAGAVTEAKNRWLTRPKAEQGALFPEIARPKQGELGFDVTGITDDAFWQEAEERIYSALQSYAEQAQNGGGYMRRLFADNATEGFAFIDLCRKQYDVVLMNPPFGEVSITSRDYVGSNFDQSKSDIGMAFVSCFARKMENDGRLGAITNRVFVANETLEKWRDEYLLGDKTDLKCFVDLGYGVLDDAKVEVAAFVIDRFKSKQSLAIFIRVLDSRDKETSASAILGGRGDQRCGTIFIKRLQDFEALPGHVIAYQLPSSFVARINKGGSLTSLGGQAKQGLIPADDFRFLRLAWEVPNEKIGFERTWCYYAKGGEYQPYWDDIHLVVNWADGGSEIRNFFGDNGKIRSRPQNLQYYFRPGVTWPERTTSDFSPRILPADCIFSATGQGIFCGTNNQNLAYIVGSYSRAFKLIVDAIYGSGDASSPGSMATHYRSGILARIPPPVWFGTDEIRERAMKLTIGGMEMFNGDETARYFSHPSIRDGSISQQVEREIKDLSKRFVRMINEHAIIDAKVFEELDFDAADRITVDTLIGPHPTAYRDALGAQDAMAVAKLWGLSESDLIRTACLKHGARRQLTMKSYAVSRRYELVAHALQVDARSVAGIVSTESLKEPGIVREVALRNVSWVFGASFGRWDISFEIGRKFSSELLDPFDPLPACPPGLLQNEHGLPITKEDIERLTTEGKWHYPIHFPWDGILLDDEGHPLDVVARMHQVLELIWNDRWGAIEHEACEILGVRTLRDYFRKPAGFFADHLKRYSKSRRQAPIYWPLSISSGKYTIWLYYHRFSTDTIYKSAEFAKEKLRHEEQRLTNFRQETGQNPTASQRKDLASMEDFVSELRTFHNELANLAPLWKPDLNDGVIINFAPLYRLIAYSPWRKEVKSCWDDLVAGKCDWSHLAMHLWPEGVVPKCAEDRSLAIAHGLDDIFWFEDTKGKWKPRQIPSRFIEEIIKERTSPAVKAALNSLLTAPQMIGTSRAQRARKNSARTAIGESL